MSEELGQSSLRLCSLCERSCDDTKDRCFRDPYSGQYEEFAACDVCYQNFEDEIRAAWRDSFWPRGES